MTAKPLYIRGLTRSGLLLTALFYCCSFAGNDPLAARIKSGLRFWYSNYPQEKIYAQTDKSVYTGGQTIWYKIYAKAYGLPSAISQVVHVQLVGADGRIILRNKLHLVNAMAAGDMQLPDSLPSGMYQLRGFTAWMLNFDESCLFHKSLYIKNIFADDVTAEAGRGPAAEATESVRQDDAASVDKYRVQFFPEGGDLITGIESNVAFKATDGSGRPVAVIADVWDGNRELLPGIRSIHDGMGSFALLPVAGHSYDATVHFPDGSVRNVDLPKARPNGIGIKVVDLDKDHISVEIRYREPHSGAYHDAVLAAWQATGAMATYPLELTPGTNTFNINSAGFAPGILRLTVFDPDGLPEAERIVFLKKANPLVLLVSGDSLSFPQKSRAAFSLRQGQSAEPADTMHLSVSVTDGRRTIDDDWNDNICSAFLLSSELKGHITRPDYYFSADDPSVNKALDLVMMTNGWRRFNWKQVLDHEPLALQFAPEQSLDLAGRIGGIKQPAAKDEATIKIVIVNSDSSKFMGLITPDSNGYFVMRGYNVTGDSKIYFEGVNVNGKRRRYRINFLEDPVDTAKGRLYELPALHVADSIEQSMQDTWNGALAENYRQQKHVLLTPAIVRHSVPTKTEQVANRYVSPGWEASIQYDLDLVDNPPPDGRRLVDYLRGRIPGLGLADADEHFFPSGASASEMVKAVAEPKGNPYFFVNERPATWYEIKEIRVNEVAFIRFMKPPAWMAPFNGGFYGVLSIYLKKWNEGIDSSGIVEKYNQYTFRGYSVTRQFYSPDNDDHPQSLPVQDNRSVLYWNPDIAVVGDKQVRFSFYHPDAVRSYRVVVEGMDTKGRLVYCKTIFDGK